jgi:hypothetical protein
LGFEARTRPCRLKDKRRFRMPVKLFFRLMTCPSSPHKAGRQSKAGKVS